MLVIARHPGDRVLVGDEVVIKVISIHDGLVRLGFEAPRSTVILRAETQQRPPSSAPGPATAPQAPADPDPDLDSES